MSADNVKKFVSLVINEARPAIVGIAPEIKELLSVKGRMGIMHFASSLTYQLNLIVGYSLHNEITADQIKDMCIHNQTKRYILVSIPDLELNMNVVDVDNVVSLVNFVTLVRTYKKLKGGHLKLSARELHEAYNAFRIVKHYVKSPTSLIQFKFVQTLRRVGIDIIKGKDPLGTKLVIVNPNIVRTISDLDNPYFRSNAGRPKKDDTSVASNITPEPDDP